MVKEERVEEKVEEKVEVEEKEVEDDASEQEEETLGDGVEEGAGEDSEDDNKFAFAMAPVVRVMKAELDKDKMIRSRVKEEMNLWLERVCRRVSQQMNQSEYTMVELDDLKTAIEPYEMIEDVEQERHRIVATMEKIKQDCDSLIRDVNRKFITYTFPQQEIIAEEESETE